MEYVHRILKEVNDAADSMKSLSKNVQETLRIAIYSSPTSQLIPKIYMDFCSLFPHYTISISKDSLSNMLKKILSGELDMAYALTPDHYDKNLYKIIPLESCEIRVLLSADHPLAKETAISLSQLQTERVFSYPIGSQIRSMIDQELQKQKIKLTQLVPHRVDFVNPLIEQNYGIAFTLYDKFHFVPDTSKIIVKPLTTSLVCQTALIFRQGLKLTNAMKDMKSYLETLVL